MTMDYRACEFMGGYESSQLINIDKLTQITGVTIDNLDGSNSLRVLLRKEGSEGPIVWSYTIPGANLAGGRNIIPGKIFTEPFYLQIVTSGTGVVYLEKLI